MNKKKETLKLSVGKPFVNEHGVIYFLKCHQDPDIFKVRIEEAKLLDGDKNKFSSTQKFTLVLAPEQKKNVSSASNTVKCLVASWGKLSVTDRKLNSFDKDSELQTVSLSKAQQENDVKKTLNNSDIEIACDSLFVSTSGEMYLRWRLI